MWEGQALPHDTKFGNSRCEIVGRRVISIWSLIHGLRWSGLIKAEPAEIWSDPENMGKMDLYQTTIKHIHNAEGTVRGSVGEGINSNQYVPDGTCIFMLIVYIYVIIFHNHE